MKYSNKARYVGLLSFCIIEVVAYAVVDVQGHVEVIAEHGSNKIADMVELENIGEHQGFVHGQKEESNGIVPGDKNIHTMDQLAEGFNKPIFGCTKENTRVIDYFETDLYTSISILEHQNGSKFVVKQDIRDPLYWHLSIARDKVGSFIAESIDMPVNMVKIIPAYGEFPGKRTIEFPATVHTFVPGFQISKLPAELRSFRIYIQQPTSRSAPQTKWGLSRRVIANMPLHPDLPKIVALDTFIANADRHYGNFFYCPKSNRYYAIDLERSFNKDLAFYACRLIKSMINDKEEFLSKYEISGLEAYRNALNSLIEKYAPEDVYNKLVEAAVEGGLISRSLRKTVLGTLQQYEPNIKKNYNSCKELVILLDQLIAQVRVKSGSTITEKSELKNHENSDQEEFLGQQLIGQDGVSGLLESTASGHEQEDICLAGLVFDVQEQVVSDAPISGLQDQAYNEGKLTSDQAFDGTAFGCDSAKVKIIDYFQTPQKTRVAILDCKGDKKFVVKQDTRDALKWHIITVRDKLGSYIAQSAGVLANRVEIIPAGFTFPGKIAIDLPATLHDFIPGISVDKLPDSLQKFKGKIKQRVDDCFPKNQCGLNRSIIHNMAEHEDLSKMVALDTFIANTDRCAKNYFYDKRSNHFYAIDLESSFNHNVAFYACQCIDLLIKSKVKLSPKELQALVVYRKTLEFLIQNNSPEDMYKKMIDFALQGNIISRTLRFSVLNKLKKYESSIKENYNSCKQLVLLLDRLVGQSRINRDSDVTENAGIECNSYGNQEQFFDAQDIGESAGDRLFENSADLQEQEYFFGEQEQENVCAKQEKVVTGMRGPIIGLEGIPDYNNGVGEAFDARSFGCDSSVVRTIDYFSTLKNTRIAILNCKNSKKFIVKQDTRDLLTWHIITVRDKLGSYIAQSAGVLANRVEIIPAGFTFPGKVAIDVPATLHDFIPGIPVNKLPDSLQKFKGKIKQRVDDYFPKNQCGLNRSVIAHMAEHEDLSKMVAFDTFIANTDRGTKNYFYDRKSNHFYAIDLESSFNHNLAFYACQCIDSLIKSKVNLSPKELQALIVYRKTLNLLIQNNSPEDMYKKMIDFALQGNIISRSFRFSVLDRLKKYESSIKANYNACKKLVRLLDRLIGQLRINRGSGLTDIAEIEHCSDSNQEQFVDQQDIGESVGDGQLENSADLQEQGEVSNVHELDQQEKVVTGMRGPIIGLEGTLDYNKGAGKAKDFDAISFGCDSSMVSNIVFFQTPKKTQIATLYCKNNKKFIVKQDTRNVLSWHIVTVRDKLGSYIAQSAGVLANRVEIIPSGFRFPGKASIDLPATLHNFIPGIQVDNLSGNLKKFSGAIKQWVDASIPKDQWGLNRSVIANMAEHEDLSKMVAFDTFIANTDRCTKNYFYDTKSNHFYAIDLESSFNYNLAFYACQCIDSLIKSKINLSPKELQALIVYRKTLNLLIQNNSPEDMYKKMINFALKGNIISRSLRISVVDRLKNYESSIKENYNSCKKLVVLLDRLIAQLRINRGLGLTEIAEIEHCRDSNQEQFVDQQDIGERVGDGLLENSPDLQEEEYVSGQHEQAEVFANQEQEVNIHGLEENESPFAMEQGLEGSPCDGDIGQLKVINCFETGHHTFISVLENQKGERFILKQETRDQLYWHLTVARDKVGSVIAESIGVPVNQVRIIPAFGTFPGKKINELPATLHTFVPGIMVNNLPQELEQFKTFIHQPVKKSLPNKEWGLTRPVVVGMALHPDLPRMAALDTFIGNADRHCGNFFYCPESNRYYAIDLESSFRNNLGFYACNCIKSMINNKHETISKKELGGLISYRNTLQLLIQIHTPESIYKSLRESALGGGLISRSLRKTVLSTLQQYENNIKDNYDSCKKLVALLDKLIAKYKHV
ncbi:MAG: hypothetical protein NT124_03930 [Candidatus Dependentiae bacterium]|nr:hypothetical protein [Candidatus Dependentiae bacterium]